LIIIYGDDYAAIDIGPKFIKVKCWYIIKT